RDAGLRNKPRGDEPGDGQDSRESPERGAHAELADGPPEEGRGDHGAGRIERDQVAVHQPAVSRHRQVHRLLHEDVARAATGAEEHAVSDDQLRQTARRGGQRDAQRAHGAAGHDQSRRRREAVDVGREVHAAAECRRRHGEDERELGSAQREQGFQRRQEHAERIERAERSIERGGGRDRVPRAWPEVRVAHDDQPAIARREYTLLGFGHHAPGAGAGLTKAQIAEARAKGVQPTRTGGFGYMQGPDNALVEYAGNHPAERFNHVHLYQEEPFCAQLWYQTHLNAPVFRGRASATPVTESTCKVPRGSERSWPALEREGMFRSPTAAVVFGDVALPWYMRQGDRRLVSTRGHLYDHIALSVADLDAWVAKLRSEGVRFLE